MDLIQQLTAKLGELRVQLHTIEQEIKRHEQALDILQPQVPTDELLARKDKPVADRFTTKVYGSLHGHVNHAIGAFGNRHFTVNEVIDKLPVRPQSKLTVQTHISKLRRDGTIKRVGYTKTGARIYRNA